MSNESAIALIFFCTLIVALLAWRNSRTERENAALFRATGELKAPKYLVLTLLALAAVASFLALSPNHRRPDDATWPMSLFGMIGVLLVWLRSFFGVRLEASTIRFGWRLRRVVPYSDIVELERRSDGREAVLRLVLQSGEHRRIGCSVSCEKLFIAELQKRTGCKVTYRLGNRVVPGPDWLPLQSACESSKAATSRNDTGESSDSK